MTDLSPILAEFERLYDVAADTFYGGEVSAGLKQDKPIITLASKGRNRTRVGWYTPGVWSDSQEDVLAGLAGATIGEQTKRAEIVVATELLDTPLLAVAELCRQQAVHAQVQYRTKVGHTNVTAYIIGSNGYYPEQWGHWAQGFGCNAAKDPEQPSRGWSKLTLGPKFTDQFVPLINLRVFDVARSNTAPRKAVGSRMKKWVCGCTTIRCATEVKALCQECNKQFTWAEAKEYSPWAVREQNDDNSPPWPAAAEPNYTSPNPNTPPPLPGIPRAADAETYMRGGRVAAETPDPKYSVTDAYLAAWQKTYANNPTTEAGG